MLTIQLLLGFTLLTVAYLAWQQHRNQQDGDPRLKAELDRRLQEIGELANQKKALQSEMDEKAGKSKQLYDNYKNLESELKIARKERDDLANQLSKFEANDEQKSKKHTDDLSKLEAARTALEDEKQRVRREDEARQEEAEAERDRLWAEHENTVVSLLNDLCKKPQFGFTTYDNNDLPEGFHGTLKPDFMIEFLGQYIIFDAKVSKGANLQTYINDQFKKTAKKIKGKDDIYPTVFLVVPTEAISELKKLSAYEEGYSFYVVSPEALEPILASLKRIENYEFAEQMDPRERENIVDLLAQLDFHISTRNAVDYHLLAHGLDTLNKMKDIDEELYREVIVKKEKMRHVNLNTAEVKELVASPDDVQAKLQELTEPKPKLQ